MEWRDIPGFEGLYQVREDGELRSLDRTVVGVDGIARRFSGSSLRPYQNGGGYLSIRLTRRAPRMVHRLVAAAFLGEPPEGHYACHNDGNRQNNHYSNLRYDTPKSNQGDRRTHGTDRRGSQMPWAKLDEDKVRTIKQRLAKGAALQSLADEYDVCKATIYLIQTGKNWKHV